MRRESLVSLFASMLLGFVLVTHVLRIPSGAASSSQFVTIDESCSHSSSVTQKRLDSPGSSRAAGGRKEVVANTARLYLKPVTLSVYPYEDHLVDVYTGLYNLDFKRLNWITYEPAPKNLDSKTFTGIVMENEYIQLTILPELGGRIYECIFKATGHNEFYQNPVLKPTRWGPPEQGWWLAAGGIEWCLPVEEHGYETAVPWQYSSVESAVGVTVTVTDSDDSNRLTARIDIHLPANKAYFAVSPHLENPTDHALNYKFWLNAMLAPGEKNVPSAELQFVYPTTRMTVHSRDRQWTGLPGPGQAFDWPIQHGRDLSILGNWPSYLGCFERPAAEEDFVGVYDHDAEEGITRVFPSEIARGAKAFAFGYGADALPSALWTDDDSAYVEIHGGIGITFDDLVSLAAGEQLTWNEYWYPVKDIGGISFANREAALNLELNPDGARIGLATTSPYLNGHIILLEDSADSLLFEADIPVVSPEQPYTAGPLPVGSLVLEQLSLSFIDSEGTVIVSFKP